jgi:putative phosphoribosyl transferase
MNTRILQIEIDGVELDAELSLPENPKGLIIFSEDHNNPVWREVNRTLAQSFRKRSYATLLCDLLSKEERRDTHLLDIDLLKNRLVFLTLWAIKRKETKNLDFILFGAGPGAATAIKASSAYHAHVRTVICMDAFPQPAKEDLSIVRTPVLFIVGGEDSQSIIQNQESLWHLQTKAELEIIPGRLHLFEEPEKIERITEAANEWYDSCAGTTMNKQAVMDLNWN